MQIGHRASSHSFTSLTDPNFSSGIPCSMPRPLKFAHKESLLLSLGILEVKLLPPELMHNCTSEQ